MNELNEEIKQTLNLMQTDIDDGAHGELQSHLYSLLEMKRNELQQRLVERSWFEPADGMGVVVKFDQAPYNSVKLEGQVADEAKALTIKELMKGGWWCSDVSEDCANAFKSKNLRVFNSSEWGDGEPWGSCALDSDGDGEVTRGFFDVGDNNQIHRIGNEFYWGEK
ncbi:MAG TPA: hypothetical protein PLZ58_03895 [Candidatus Saccharibacteria bacterium]|nr:hypothetical protein [Candidatus Saccharibacteria bacterium]